MAIQDNKIVTYDDISTKLNEPQSTSNECPPKLDIVNTYVTVSKEPYGSELIPYEDNQCVQYKDIVLGLVDITVQQSAGGTISVVYDGKTYTSGTFKALAGRELQIRTTYHVTDNNYKILWWDKNTSQSRVWTVTGPTVIRADYYQFNTNSDTSVRIYNANTIQLNITSIKNTVASVYQVDIPDWLTVTKNTTNVQFVLTDNTGLENRTHTIIYTQDGSGLTSRFVLTQGGRKTIVKWSNSANIMGVSKTGTTVSRALVYSSTYSASTGFYNKQALVTSAAAWLTYSDPTITVAANPGPDIEEGTLLLTNNGIDGIVPQGDLDILVERMGLTRYVQWTSTATWSPSNTTNSTTRTISYSGDKTTTFEPVAGVTTNQPWLRASISGTTVTISVDTNIIGCNQLARTGTVTLTTVPKSGLIINGSISFNVTQAMWQTNCSFSTSTTNLSWTTSGGTTNVTVYNSDGSTTSNWDIDTTGTSNRYTITKSSNNTIQVIASNSISSTVLNSSFKVRQLGCCTNVITINLSTAAWAKTKNSVLTVSPTSWTPSKYGASQTFTSTSYIDIYDEGTNGGYTRNYPAVTWSDNQGWITLNSSSGAASVGDNSDGDYRSGTITASNGYKSVNVSVAQDGAAYEFAQLSSISLGCSGGSSDYTDIRSTKNGNSQSWTMTTGTSSGFSASPGSGSNGTRLTVTNNNCNNGGSDYIILTQAGSGNTLRINYSTGGGCCCAGYYTYTVRVYNSVGAAVSGATVRFGNEATEYTNSSGVATYTRCGSAGCITVTVSASGYNSVSGTCCADSTLQFGSSSGGPGGITPVCQALYFQSDVSSISFTAAGGLKTYNTRNWYTCGDGTYYWIVGHDGVSAGTQCQWITSVNGNGGQTSDHYYWSVMEITLPINKSTSARSCSYRHWAYKKGVDGNYNWNENLDWNIIKNVGYSLTINQAGNVYVFRLNDQGGTTAVCSLRGDGTAISGSNVWPACQDATGSANWPGWTVTSKPSWVTTNVSSGVNGTQLNFRGSTNTGSSARSGNVVITQAESGKTCTITVNQAASVAFGVAYKGITYTSAFNLTSPWSDGLAGTPGVIPNKPWTASVTSKPPTTQIISISCTSSGSAGSECYIAPTSNSRFVGADFTVVIRATDGSGSITINCGMGPRDNNILVNASQSGSYIFATTPLTIASSGWPPGLVSHLSSNSKVTWCAVSNSIAAKGGTPFNAGSDFFNTKRTFHIYRYSSGAITDWKTISANSIDTAYI